MGYTCIKYVMFAFNFIFWMLGCGLIGVGIWGLVDKNIHDNVGNTRMADILIAAAAILLVIGVIMMVTGFLGCCGAVRESQCMLFSFFIVLFIIFTILMGTGIYVLITKDNKTFEETVRKGLRSQLTIGKGKDQKLSILPIVEENFKCCGIDGPQDYLIKNSVKPSARCKTPIGDILKGTQGCLKPLVEFLREKIVYIGAVAVVIGFIMILGMIFSLCLCCEIRKAVS